MRMRVLGQSGVMVGEVGLGTWGFSGEGYGPIDKQTVADTLAAAADEGVTFLETADCYAGGWVERAIGDFLRGRNRERFVVSTRIGVDRRAATPRKDFSAKYLTAACDASLERLGTEAVDVLALHNPLTETLTRGEAWAALERLRQAGKAKLLGVSAGSVAQARAALSLGADVLIVPYNVLYSGLLHAVSGEVVSTGAAVVARSPLAYGLLGDGWTASRRFDDEDHRSYRWTAAEFGRRVRQREAVRMLVHDTVKTLPEAALRSVLSNGLVSVVVPGARTPEQARANAHAADVLPYLEDNDLAGLPAVLARAGVRG